jgi:hypothetical protein
MHRVGEIDESSILISGISENTKKKENMEKKENTKKKEKAKKKA